MRAARLTVRGHVQGVGFRYAARQQAMILSLNGWVRNTRDGSVEALAQGQSDSIERFVQWAENGPSGSAVERVDVEYVDLEPDLHGFRIRD